MTNSALLLLTAALIMPATSPHSALSPDATTAPTTAPVRPPYIEHLIFTRVNVANIDAGEWMVDTGANTSVIDASNPAAGKLIRLPLGARAESPQGSREVLIGTLPDVDALGREFRGLSAIVLDLSPAAKIMGRPLDGVLGVNALGDVYRLDFPNRRYESGPFPKDTPGLAEHAWAPGTLGPSTLAEINGVPARLTIDSGKNRVLTLSRAFLARHKIDFVEEKGGLGYDAAGLNRAGMTTLTSLKALGREARDVRTVLGEREPNNSDGLIGLGFFHEAVIEVDVKGRKLKVKWPDAQANPVR